MAKTKKKQYAKVTSLDIRPIVESSDTFNYFFRDPIFAKRKIDLIKEKYIVSRENEDSDNGDVEQDERDTERKKKEEQVILWIRNFEVTPEERLAGYKGNYGRIFIKKVEHEELEEEEKSSDEAVAHIMPLFNGEPFYTLCIEKIPRRASHHPERKIVKRRHPNWGHPILRQIKHHPDFIYHSYFEAFNELRRLQTQYPEVSYLTKQLMYIIVYAKAKDEDTGFSSRPIQKIILEIKEVGEDQFKIQWSHNPVEGKLTRDKINMVNLSFFN